MYKDNSKVTLSHTKDLLIIQFKNCVQKQCKVYMHCFFYARWDVFWYGDIRPSVYPSGSPSVSHSFPHFSPTCFDVLSWNFVCHFLLINFRSSSSVVNFRHFFGVVPLLVPRILKIRSFQHISPTCFDILS